MHRARVIVMAIVMSGCLASCGSVSFEDISSNPGIAPLIGNRYVTEMEFIVQGVNMDSPVEQHVDEYSITRPPGFAGRYVIERYTMPRGTLIQVKRIWRCIDCYLDWVPRIKIEVTFPEVKDAPNLPYHFDISCLVWAQNEEATLSEDCFRALEGQNAATST